MAEDAALGKIILKTNAEVRPLVESWVRSLEADGKGHRTLENYANAVRSISAWSVAAGLPLDPRLQTVDQLRRYIAVQLQTGGRGGAKASRRSVALRFGCLQHWFQWLVDEGELDVSPMAKLKSPRTTRSASPPEQRFHQAW